MKVMWRIEREDEFGDWIVCSQFSSRSRKKVASELVKQAVRNRVKYQQRFRVINETNGEIEVVKKSDLKLKRQPRTNYWGVEEKKWPEEIIGPVSQYLDLLLSEEPVDHWRALNLARVDGKIDALMKCFTLAPNGCFDGPIPWNDCLAEYLALQDKQDHQTLSLNGRDNFKNFRWLNLFENLSNIEITGDFSDATIDFNHISESSKRKIKNVFFENVHINTVRGLFSNEIESISLHRSYVAFLEPSQEEWGKNLQSLYWSQNAIQLDLSRLVLTRPLGHFGLVNCPIPHYNARLVRRGFKHLTMDGANLKILVKKMKAAREKKVELQSLSLEGETYLGDVCKFVKFLEPKELDLYESLYDQLAEGNMYPEAFMKLLPPPPCKICFGSYDFGKDFFPKNSGYDFG